MNSKSITQFIPLTLTLAAFAGCSQSSSSSGSALDNVPAVAPIVDSALPSTLKAGTTVAARFLSFFKLPSAQANASSDILADLQVIFKSSYSTISGGHYTGYVNSLLSDLDGRVDGLKNMSSGKSASCTSNPSQAYTIDLSGNVDTALKLALDLQCSASFATAPAAAGSGMAWGVNANGDYSLWLTLNHTGLAGDGFGYAAKVTHPTTAAKSVDMLFVEASSQNSRGSVARLRATPASNTYELLYASTSSNALSPVGGATAHMGCQFQMISDGTLIYVKGNYVTGGACSGGTVEDACINASDLSANNVSGACDALKTSFTISNTPNSLSHTEIDGLLPTSSELTLYNAIQESNASAVTTSFSPQ